MKKSFLFVAVAGLMALASCGGEKPAETTTVDTVAVAPVETTTVDTTAVTVDTTAVAADTTKK